MNKRQMWIGGGAVLAVLILVAGWFLVVSPVRSDTSKTKAQTASVVSDNDRMQAQLNQLIALKKNVTDKQAELSNIAAEIPGDPQLPRLIRQLTGIAGDAGVDLVALTPSQPTAPTTSTPTGATSLGSSSPTGSTATHVAPRAAADTYLTIPVALQVQGDYAGLEEFLQRLETLKRIFILGQIALTPGSSLGATTAAQLPDGSTGDLHILNATLTGSVFMTDATNIAINLPALNGPAASTATSSH